MKEMLCVVQLLHPGAEHRPGKDGLKAWNTGTHRRKFLLGRGTYWQDRRVHTGQFAFWGEWEPPSRCVSELDNPGQGRPQYLVKPMFERVVSYGGLQNTDPFVFGESFLYTACLQYWKRGPTQLRCLSRGSVILFGSCVRSRFVLDTVFVVAHHEDHSAEDYLQRLRGRVPDTYIHATLEPLYANLQDRRRKYRLYFGASYDAHVEGMFSFVPCRPAGGDVTGFARPRVKMPGVIKPTLKQGKKLTCHSSMASVQSCWEDVRRQVLKQELALGLRVEVPRTHRGKSNSPEGRPSSPCS